MITVIGVRKNLTRTALLLRHTQTRSLGPDRLKNKRANDALKRTARLDAHVYQFDPAPIHKVAEFLGELTEGNVALMGDSSL